MRLTFDTDGLENKLAALEALGANSDEVIEGACHEVALVMQRVARGLAPVDTGELRRKIRVHKLNDGRRGYVVSSDAAHGAAVEFGTGPTFGDPEVAHTAKSHWVYKTRDGRFITTRGQKPQPYMRPAYNAAKRQAEKLIGAHIDKQLRKLGG